MGYNRVDLKLKRPRDFMRFSKLVTKTMRTDPSEAETPSHRFMLKSGMIHQIASGVYAYLPLAWRALRKIESIIREEMDNIGSQEVRMPVLQPMEIWQESGRSETFGDNLFTLKDRRGRTMVIAPTHEEVLSYLAKTHVQSYRDLPVILYQIQTKFRDEPRSRGGLIRVREFDMKDAYSLDADEFGLEKSYQSVAQAYKNIYQRCGLPAIKVEADSGAIGGKDSHEFVLPVDTGEDTIITCPGCGYAANLEKAHGVKLGTSGGLVLPIEEVSTPGVKTIAELANYLNIPESMTLKAVFYDADGEVIFVTIRGDLEVNEIKLKNFLGVHNLRLASEDEVGKAGLVAGSASPVGLSGFRRVADDSILLGFNFVVGANKSGAHFINANYPRDFQVDDLVDISQVKAGQTCSDCGGVLQSVRGIEVGHIFKLGTFFSENLGVYFLNEMGDRRPVVMGCYGIGLGRLLAAAIEQNHDDKGIMFPVSISPYHVHLIGLNVDDPKVSNAANDLYLFLWNKGIECLYDDRVDETAGVKFNDADLLGIPVRLVVSKRTLKEQSVELKMRWDSGTTLVSLEDVEEQIRRIIFS